MLILCQYMIAVPYLIHICFCQAFTISTLQYRIFLHCHAHSVSKGVILWNNIPYALAMQEHNEWAGSASGTWRSKVMEMESSMIEKEAVALKHKDFVFALYLMGMHSNKTKDWAHLLRNLFCIRKSKLSGMHLHVVSCLWHGYSCKFAIWHV